MSVRRPRVEEEVDDDDQDGSSGSAEEHQQRRHGARRLRPVLSFRSVVRRAVAAETIQQIVLNLEPVIRRVVREEIRNIFPQYGHDLPHRSLTLQIQDVGVSPPLKLVFTKQLKLPIFTNNKLVDIDNNPIEIQLVDTRTNLIVTPSNTHLGYSAIKLEVLVLDGDFRYDEDGARWTDDQFSTAIVKAREGRRPLLVGTVSVTMSNHGVAVIDDVSFTDNSSWIRSRKFRIGVRVVMLTDSCGLRIQEAVSESFTVKDHRGELYKKHFPPLLTDNVWRLRNIGKDGPIDKRLEAEGIKNVQDFLKLNTMNPNKLKSLVGMSDRQWSATLKQAKSCDMGGKCYVFKSEGCEIKFNPVGEILAVRFGGRMCSLHELLPHQMVQIKQLVSQAYQQWDQMEEVQNEMALVDKSLIPFHDEKPMISSGMPSYINQAEGLMENSGWEPSEMSQESMISSASQNAMYVDSLGTATTSTAEMVTNNISTLEPASTVPDSALYSWNSGMAADDHFSWQNNTNLVPWDHAN
ncbi:hypothetical protein DAI22_08g129400 [Oryza sativa Japonica Group]|uniref:Calmodulin-binding protein-like n=1 Tax=Oryza rufipogon TaxID=4529 RepID=A0A0E0QI07_ORYRU|nr:hypothetical protein DAI22_08g129400 [Oryza sativa Japonica Group]KAF2919365.1 hypothetical protein DAI22_08g129400 [Oryza sativa Japonica Group]